MLEQRTDGEPIWVSTLSSHWRGPLRCSSIQQGVLVTVCRLHTVKKHLVVTHTLRTSPSLLVQTQVGGV